MKHLVCCAMLLALPACTQSTATEPPATTPTPLPPVPENLTQARTFFATRCAGCHGNNGAGDGPMARMLKPNPRDLSNPVWQETIDDASIIKIIHEGGGAVGRSLSMPASPDLKDNAKLTAELVQLIRSFKRTGP